VKILWSAILICLSAALFAADTPFAWRIAATDGSIVITVDIAPDCYLYADDTRIELTDGRGQALPPESAPSPVEHEDTLLGIRASIYPAGSHEWRYRPAGTAPYAAMVYFQGCRDNTPDTPGICFAPARQALRLGNAETPASVEMPERNGAVSVEAQVPSWRRFAVTATGGGYLKAKRFLAFLERGDSGNAGDAAAGAAKTAWYWVLLLTLLGGIGLNLTPCVLPMIPVNLAIIGAGKNASSRWSAFFRASGYALGMMLAYGVLGVVVVVAGARFGTLNASWGFNAVIAVVFLILAIAMSGLIPLDFSRYSANLKVREWKLAPIVLAFVLGAVAALLAGACVAPVVLATLAFAAGSYAEGAWWGLALPFVLGLGMALPWPLVGLGFKVLPKPGAWMVWIKYAFAAFILGMAGYYGYLAWTLARTDYSPSAELARLENRLQLALAERRPVLLDFYATWCKNCAAMDSEVFTDPAVEKRLEDFVVVRFRAEQLDAPELAPLLNACKVNGLPAFAILTPKRTDGK